MSVSFLGVNHTLDVSNGTAARMLRAMGHPVGPSTDGRLDVREALAGIALARKMDLYHQDQRLLEQLEHLVVGLQRAGKQTLFWV